jgi:hypothetical protein
MTLESLYSVTYRRPGDEKITVEIHGDEHSAFARRDQITGRVGRVVVAEQGMNVGRPVARSATNTTRPV